LLLLELFVNIFRDFGMQEIVECVAVQTELDNSPKEISVRENRLRRECPWESSTKNSVLKRRYES